MYVHKKKGWGTEFSAVSTTSRDVCKCRTQTPRRAEMRVQTITRTKRFYWSTVYVVAINFHVTAIWKKEEKKPNKTFSI